jgi:branched-chain amino acid transport system substrate-binding protein
MRKLKSGIFIICLSLLLITFLFAGACSTAPGEAKTLKVGLITAITGPMSGPLKSFYDAAGPTEQLINNMGGITVNGQKYNIQIVAADDQSTPQGAVTAAIKLLQEDIKFVSTPITPNTLTACTPTLEEAKVIGGCPSQMDPGPYTTANHYSFNCWATEYLVFPTLDYLQKNYPNVKRIAYVLPDDPGPNFDLSVLEKEMPKRGLQAVASERFPGNTTDFMPIVTKVMGTNPDAIMFAGIVPWVAGITNSSRDLGFTGPLFGVAPCGDWYQVKAMVMPEYAYDIFYPAPDVKSDKMPTVAKDLRKLVEQSGMEFNFDTIMPLGALWPILQGVEKAQSFDTDTVVDTLEKMEVSSPWSEAKGKWMGEEFGYQHQLVLDKAPMTKLAKSGVLEFEYIKQ